MNKNEFRQKQIECLKQIDVKTKSTKEEIITKNFFDQAEVQRAQNIAITMSNGFELDTEPIVQQLIKEAKNVYIPRTLPNHQMEFVRYDPSTQMQPKFFGILEPIDGEVVQPERLDVIVVPGLSYEITEGYRLGFGAGYYDRYLRKTDADKIVLAFSEQIYSKPEWDVEDFDVPLEKIITEKGIQFER